MRDNRFTVGTGEVGALFNACPEDVAVELDCLGCRRDDDEGCEGGIACLLYTSPSPRDS